VRGLQRTKLELGLGRGESPPTTTGHVRSQLRRSFEERGRGGDSAAGPRPPCGVLQLAGDRFIEARSRVGAMPRTTIGIDVGIGRLGERAVHLLTVGDGRRLVDHRAQQGVPEPDMGAELDEPR
jgi:hypothetical protein